MATTETIVATESADIISPIELQQIGPQESNLPPAPAGDERDGSEYPKGSKFFFIVVGLILQLLLAGLDINIVSTAIPSITDEFHTIADVGWYYTAYRLSSSSLQFAFGRLYKQYPTKPLILLSSTIFLLGSTLCATAVSSKMFVVGRAVTGIGVAGGAAGFFKTLIELVPLRQRPLYGGLFGAVEGLSGIAAPPLGGLITQTLSWRWCFYLNLPIGGVGLIGLVFLMPTIKNDSERIRFSWKATLHQLDVVGSLFFIPSLAALFIAFNWAGTKYSWSDDKIVALFVAFGVLLVAFMVDQVTKGDAAILPLRLLKNRSVIAGFIFSTCVASALSLFEWYAPTFFQVVLRYSPAHSGYMLLPCLIATLVGALVQGSGTSYFGYYTPFAIASSVLLSVGGGLLTTWSPSTSLARLISYLVIVGFAAGVGFMVPQNSMQTALPKADSTLGLAIVLFAQNFGPALFVSVAQAIFTNRLAANLHALVPNANATNIEQMGYTQIRRHFDSADTSKIVFGFSEAISQTWYLALGLACFSVVGALLLDWSSVKTKET